MSRKHRNQPPQPVVEEPAELRLDTKAIRNIGSIWFILLLLGIASAAFQAWRQTGFVEEFPVSCDSFGYLQMAEDMRHGSAPHDLPKFTAASPKATALIAEMQRLNIPQIEWDALIGPQAYNYKPSVQRLVNQYPPGVALLLSQFPRGRALATLYSITLTLLMLLSSGGLLLMLLKWWRSPNILLLGAASVWSVGFNLAFMMLGTTVSYSADFFTVPGIAALLLVYLGDRSSRLSWLCVVFAGALVGFAMLIRLPAALLVPGYLLLVYFGGSTLRQRTFRCVAFLAPLFLAGILPLMLHQQALVGSPFATTYGLRDTSSPTSAAIANNIAYYFSGEGSLGNWTILLAIVGTAAGIMFVWQKPLASAPAYRHRHWLYGMATLFLLPAAYFLTHTISTSYYQLPALLTATLAAALALLAAAREPLAAFQFTTARKLALILLLLPGFAHLLVAFTPTTLTTAGEFADHDTSLVPDLKDPNAWILADRYTGTLWYFHGLHAQNILNSTPRSRLTLYSFAFARHEKMFIIVDIPSKPSPFTPILQEIQQWGGTFRDAGRFDGQHVGEIIWPPKGPSLVPGG